MKNFGLIGYPLGHSFSKKYFTEKFEKEGLNDCAYHLFALPNLKDFNAWLDDQNQLIGLNVTIPYKTEIIPFLDELSPQAERIGAVNTIQWKAGKRIGHNTDYIGFKNSLVAFIGAKEMPNAALILGTGGASKAVKAALEDLNIAYTCVSRSARENTLSYEELHQPNFDLKDYPLIINTTPLGMVPDVSSLPNLPYEQLSTTHMLYDLVYNPLQTAFMQKGIEAKCWVKNGLEMLQGQAEAAWGIWDS